MQYKNLHPSMPDAARAPMASATPNMPMNPMTPGMSCPEGSRPGMPESACADWQGKLPACAPLANPFVPFQQVSPERYEMGKALIRGTLFPGLDLPYRGMVNTVEKNGSPLSDIQALGFAIQELGLYLDTHRWDAEAVALFNQYAERYEDAVQQYEQNGGVLMQLRSAQSGTYDWLNDPWPWENKEG